MKHGLHLYHLFKFFQSIRNKIPQSYSSRFWIVVIFITGIFFCFTACPVFFIAYIILFIYLWLWWTFFPSFTNFIFIISLGFWYTFFTKILNLITQNNSKIQKVFLRCIGYMIVTKERMKTYCHIFQTAKQNNEHKTVKEILWKSYVHGSYNGPLHRRMSRVF